MSAQNVLLREYKELSREQWVAIDLDDANVFKWSLALIVVNPESMYYGGYFAAEMTFPDDYPYSPPDFKFLKPLWHPNVYPDGRLCISILHAPGEDSMSGEAPGERWSPAQRVESVLLSILSLLDDPEINSPANVDASVMFRDNQPDFRTRVARDVAVSKKSVPEGFVLPAHEPPRPTVTEKVDDDFWMDSDEDADFGDLDDGDMLNGSESDEALNRDEDDDDDEEDDEDFDD